MKIVRVFFIVALVFIVFLPGTEMKSGDYEHKVIHYVALGDSIAKGYGLDDVDTESYVGRVARSLEQQYGAVRLKNFGKNGLRSEQLLDILTNQNNDQHENYMEEISRADLITLSIGSNDLLQYLSADMDFKEFEEHGDEIFTQACERFQENIPKIIDAIHSQAPQAQLFVNNIYNPCNDISFELSEHLDEMAEKYIVKMNEGFVSEEVQSVFHSMNGGDVQLRDEGYELVDVKQAFEQADEKLINMVISWKEIDPHPNREGHKRIADEIIPKLSLSKAP